MEVINRHSARLADVMPGERGTVDETNPTVVAALAARLLVDAKDAAAEALAAAGGESALLDENAALKAKLVELEAALAAAKPAPAPRAGRAMREG